MLHKLSLCVIDGEREREGGKGETVIMVNEGARERGRARNHERVTGM